MGTNNNITMPTGKAAFTNATMTLTGPEGPVTVTLIAADMADYKTWAERHGQDAGNAATFSRYASSLASRTNRVVEAITAAMPYDDVTVREVFGA